MENENETTPQLGDHVDLPRLTRTLTETMTQTLATRLAREGVALELRMFQSIVGELARNTAQALAGVPLVDVYGLAAPTEPCICAECIGRKAA